EMAHAQDVRNVLVSLLDILAEVDRLAVGRGFDDGLAAVDERDDANLRVHRLKLDRVLELVGQHVDRFLGEIDHPHARNVDLPLFGSLNGLVLREEFLATVGLDSLGDDVFRVVVRGSHSRRERDENGSGQQARHAILRGGNGTGRNTTHFLNSLSSSFSRYLISSTSASRNVLPSCLTMTFLGMGMPSLFFSYSLTIRSSVISVSDP